MSKPHPLMGSPHTWKSEYYNSARKSVLQEALNKHGIKWRAKDRVEDLKAACKAARKKALAMKKDEK